MGAIVVSDDRPPYNEAAPCESGSTRLKRWITSRQRASVFTQYTKAACPPSIAFMLISYLI
jgi:hypothetical protein